MQRPTHDRRKLGLTAFLLSLGLTAWIFWAAIPVLRAQTATNSPAAAATNAAASGTNTLAVAATNSPAGATNTLAEAKKLPDDLIQLSLQNANVDMVVQWLSEQTGKSVVKHPHVQCQVTIVGAGKVTRREAITLVYRALALEGFAAIESTDSILIVPEDQQPKISPQMYGSSTNTSPGGNERLVKVFSLKHAQAAAVKEKLKAVTSEKATVETDDAANVVVVTDYADNVSVATQLVAQLDTDKPLDMTVRVIPLKNANAADLAKEIMPLYQKLTGRNEKATIEVSANELSNSLLILSSEPDFDALEKVVGMLDSSDAQETVTQPFVLKNADAEDVAKQLEQLYNPQQNNDRYPYFFFGMNENSQKERRKFSVISDRRRNALIVQAAPNQMERIGKLIASLDEPIDDGSLAPKIYILKYVSASDIEDVLNELFLKKTTQRPYYFFDEAPQETPERDVGRLYGKVRITSEPYSNAIIITSNSSEALAAVEDVLRQLDQPSQSGETTFRVALRFAKAQTLANNLNILFAKGGSPAFRPQNQNNPNNPQPQQPQGQQPQNNTSQSNFELETEAKEEGYYPWLGGQPDVERNGERTTRPVSDLIGRVRAVADERSNSLLISANVHFFPEVIKLIDQMDIPTAQVMIDARIVEVSTDFLDQLGVRWSPNGSAEFTGSDLDNGIVASATSTYQKGFNGTTTVNTPVNSGNSAAAAIQALANLKSGVVANTINVDFLIQFLKEHTDATVLAEPQIKIEDNELGKLFVGQQVPFIDNSLVNAVGGQSQSFTYKDVGVILEVTPHVNDSGDVLLRVRAESSTIVPGETILGGAVINTRNFLTELTAKTGQTLVLGGIIQKQFNQTQRKTPFFGSIPGLKWAFNNKDRNEQRDELLIFLKPKVVRTPQEARELLEDTEKNTPLIEGWEKTQGTNNDLPFKKSSS